MITGNLYGYVKKLNKLKILGSSNVYTVATLLRNCHVAMYVVKCRAILMFTDSFLRKVFFFFEITFGLVIETSTKALHHSK